MIVLCFFHALAMCTGYLGFFPSKKYVAHLRQQNNGMNIGFDAKRAFHNTTGLGHYSRTLLRSLQEFFPEHRYFLFNPKPSRLFDISALPSVQEITPESFFFRRFPALWRSRGVLKACKKAGIELYHGLSHELPQGIEKTAIRCVVTMHDLIHERYPHQYPWIDRKVYTLKFRYACKVADRIIAISQQTKDDLIQFYGVNPQKITVCYQSCNPAFGIKVSEAEKMRVKQMYALPDRFFLYVGSVIERKNLLNICKALDILRNEVQIPLVVIGSGGAYLQKVKQYVAHRKLEKLVLFLSETKAAQSEKGYQTATDFPAIYQQALAMIYPSFFEGFGIPVLEALWSRLPVITSNVSCLPEAGGEGAFYVNPTNPDEIAAQMKTILQDSKLVESKVASGYAHAQQFSNYNTAARVMQVYRQVLSS